MAFTVPSLTTNKASTTPIAQQGGGFFSALGSGLRAVGNFATGISFRPQTPAPGAVQPYSYQAPASLVADSQRIAGQNQVYSAPSPSVAQPGYLGYAGNQPNVANLSANVSPNVNMSTLQKNPTTYADLLQKIQDNQSMYLGAFQKSAGEQQAEQNLLDAIGRSQNLQASVRAGQVNELYGSSVKPMALATGAAAELGQQNQLAILNAQNAQNLAQQALGYQQTSRQIGIQGAQFGQQNLMGLAGLMKPVEIQPGSSLVGPTGDVAFQGSGFRPPGPQDVQALATQLLQNGSALDYPSAMLQATQYYQQQQMQGIGGTQLPGQYPGSTPATLPNFVQGNVVNGYNLSTYATDPRYAAKVGAIAQQIPTSMNPNSMQQYISSIAPNSPVTGQDVYNASSTYGVDPHVLMAVLQNESQFGTKGAGARTNNPGNVGNTDSGATRQYKSVYDGVAATADQLAKRFVGAQAPSSVSSMIPTPLQSLVLAAPNGGQYLNIDKVPTQLQNLAKITAPQAGVTILNQAEASAVQTAGGVLDNMQKMSSAVDTILGSGVGGRLKGLTINKLQQFFESNTDISSFIKWRNTAINALQSLAGGSGSGLRITNSEIDNAISTMPEISDNLETAKAKIAGIQNLVNTKLNSLLPNSVPTQSISGGGANANDPLGLFQ